MYDKHIIVGGQSSTALTNIFIDAGTKSCASANKMDGHQQSQHNMKKRESTGNVAQK